MRPRKTIDRPKTKQVMSLDEKSKICKKAGITYGVFQQITEGCTTKRQIYDAVNAHTRKRFLDKSERIADGVRVYP